MATAIHYEALRKKRMLEKMKEAQERAAQKVRQKSYRNVMQDEKVTPIMISFQGLRGRRDGWKGE